MALVFTGLSCFFISGSKGQSRRGADVSVCDQREAFEARRRCEPSKVLSYNLFWWNLYGVRRGGLAKLALNPLQATQCSDVTLVWVGGNGDSAGELIKAETVEASKLHESFWLRRRAATGPET